MDPYTSICMFTHIRQRQHFFWDFSAHVGVKRLGTLSWIDFSRVLESGNHRCWTRWATYSISLPSRCPNQQSVISRKCHIHEEFLDTLLPRPYCVSEYRQSTLFLYCSVDAFRASQTLPVFEEVRSRTFLRTHVSEFFVRVSSSTFDKLSFSYCVRREIRTSWNKYQRSVSCKPKEENKNKTGKVCTICERWCSVLPPLAMWEYASILNCLGHVYAAKTSL